MLIDNLTNLNRSTRNAVFGALIVIAAVAMYNWIVTPHVNCLFAAQRYESIVSKTEEKNKVAARRVETKTKKLQKLHNQLNDMRNILSTSKESQEFFGGLQDIVEETGCKVNALNLATREQVPANKRKQSEYDSNVIANSAMLTVSGTYKDIVKLVEKLQNRTKRIWMDSFKIETTASKPGQLKCNMTIIVYTIPEEFVL